MGLVTVLGAIGIKDVSRRRLLARCGCLMTQDTCTCVDKPRYSGHQDSCNTAVFCCTSRLISDARALLACSLRVDVHWHGKPARTGVFMIIVRHETLATSGARLPRCNCSQCCDHTHIQFSSFHQFFESQKQNNLC